MHASNMQETLSISIHCCVYLHTYIQHAGRHYFSWVHLFVNITYIGHVGCADKLAEKHCWLICYERKILFRLKKQVEKYGL
jgi:hypothetical protein